MTAYENTTTVEPEKLGEVRQKLFELRMEHRDLDEAIAAMHERAYVDQLQLRRLKKRKLLIKDMIVRLESELIPDLDA